MPSFAARLAFGEMADDMLIGGVRVEPHVLEANRFDFAYPQLEVALRHILHLTAGLSPSRTRCRVRRVSPPRARRAGCPHWPVRASRVNLYV